MSSSYTASPLMMTYCERLRAHMMLSSGLQESLLEVQERSGVPAPLQLWLAEALEHDREQARVMTRLLRQHGDKAYDEHETVSSVLDTMISCLPSGEVPFHLLGAVLNLAGDIARQRASLALLRLLAEKLVLKEDEVLLAGLKRQSREMASALRKVLPALLDNRLSKRI